MNNPAIGTQGLVVIDLIGLGLIILILELVRTHRLHVGYGVLWLLAVLVLMIVISFVPLLNLITQAVGAVYPASALSLLAFVFIFLMLVFFSVHLSVLASRQVELAQSQALRELGDREFREPRESKDEDQENRTGSHDSCP